MTSMIGRRTRGEDHPELLDPPGSVGRTGCPTAAEAVRYARDRHRALKRVRRAERGLERLGARLVAAALAVGEPAGPRRAAPQPTPASTAEPYAAGLSLPRWFAVVVLVLIGAVEFLFWITLGRQSVRYDDYVSPAALQAVGLAVLFPVVAVAGAVLAAPIARLPLLPAGTRDSWYRARAWIGLVLVAAMSVAMGVTAFTRFATDSAEIGARPMPVLPLSLAFALLPFVAMAVHAYSVHPDEEIRHHGRRENRRYDGEERAHRTGSAARHLAHHRAALALEARINRVLAGYHRDVAASDTRVLAVRARQGHGEPYPTLVDRSPAALPSVESAEPVSWLGIPTPPKVQAVIEPSLRLLRRYRPEALETPALPPARPKVGP